MAFILAHSTSRPFHNISHVLNIFHAGISKISFDPKESRINPSQVSFERSFSKHKNKTGHLVKSRVKPEKKKSLNTVFMDETKKGN